jgi:hypothetical protein
LAGVRGDFMDEDFKKSPLAPLFQRGVLKNWHDMPIRKFVAHPPDRMALEIISKLCKNKALGGAGGSLWKR